MLIHAMTTKQITGMAGQEWERYFAKIHNTNADYATGCA